MLTACNLFDLEGGDRVAQDVAHVRGVPIEASDFQPSLLSIYGNRIYSQRNYSCPALIFQHSELFLGGGCEFVFDLTNSRLQLTYTRFSCQQTKVSCARPAIEFGKDISFRIDDLFSKVGLKAQFRCVDLCPEILFQ